MTAPEVLAPLGPHRVTPTASRRTIGTDSPDPRDPAGHGVAAFHPQPAQRAASHHLHPPTSIDTDRAYRRLMLAFPVGVAKEYIRQDGIDDAVGLLGRHLDGFDLSLGPDDRVLFEAFRLFADLDVRRPHRHETPAGTDHETTHTNGSQPLAASRAAP